MFPTDVKGPQGHSLSIILSILLCVKCLKVTLRCICKIGLKKKIKYDAYNIAVGLNRSILRDQVYNLDFWLYLKA